MKDAPRSAFLALGLALASGLAACGRGSSTTGTGPYLPITGKLRLTVRADAEFGSAFWAVLRRDGADEWRIERVKSGQESLIAWREDVTGPRDWKLKFGPSRHPTYQLLLLRDAPSKPEIRLAELGSYHDPEKSLAIAYFAVPLDGEKSLDVLLRKPEPLVVSLLDPKGEPLSGQRVVGISTPRYLFEDGFDPERVDAMQLTWSWDFWNFDHVPSIKISPSRIVTAKTNAEGACRWDAFVGWVGVSERDERFALPRSVLAGPELRQVRICVVQNPPSVRLSAQGLPGRDVTITERGLVAEGDWPLPEGFRPARWSERLSFLQAPTSEFFTPCRQVNLRPLSKVHRVSSGQVIGDLKPGEARKHKVVLEELEHRTLGGEVVFEETDRISREHCGIELYDGGSPPKLVRAAGSLGGPGVPKSGRVPFEFHVLEEGPFTLVVRTGNYSCPVIRGLRAPREDLEVRVSLEKKNIPCSLTVRGRDGSEVAGYVVGTWPHGDLVSDFISGSRPSGKPGLNTFIIHSESGSAILRDVRLEEGRSAKLEAIVTPGVRLTGRLVDQDGRPVAGQWVHLSWPGYFRMASAFRWLSDLTGADGRFEIPSVPPGAWRLYLRGSGAPAGEPFTVPEAGVTWEAGDLRVPRSEAPGTK